MKHLREAIVNWAQGEPNVRAVLQTGSFAREQDDALSDHDIELYCTDPSSLLEHTGWFRLFAPVWAYQALDELHFPTRLVLFEGGRKVDFAILPVSMLHTGQLSVAARAGFMALVDKDDLTASLPTADYQISLPTQAEFARIRAHFWMESWSWAKYLARGDGWHARIRDNDTKVALLQMMEWYALTLGQTPRHAGHFLADWTDSHTRAVLPSLWSDWNRSLQWRALQASCDLFAHHEQQVAQTFDLSLTSVNASAIHADIERIQKLDIET